MSFIFKKRSIPELATNLDKLKETAMALVALSDDKGNRLSPVTAPLYHDSSSPNEIQINNLLSDLIISISYLSEEISDIENRFNKMKEKEDLLNELEEHIKVLEDNLRCLRNTLVYSGELLNEEVKFKDEK